MKTTFTSIAAFSAAVMLLSSGCSHKATKTSADSNSSQFVLAAGDISAPAETTTDRFDTIHVQIKLSAARADELNMFYRQHLNQTTELLVGTNVITKLFVPPDPTLLPSGGTVEIVSPSADDAHHIAAELDKLVK